MCEICLQRDEFLRDGKKTTVFANPFDRLQSAKGPIQLGAQQCRIKRRAPENWSPTSFCALSAGWHTHPPARWLSTCGPNCLGHNIFSSAKASRLSLPPATRVSLNSTDTLHLFAKLLSIFICLHIDANPLTRKICEASAVVIV